MVSFICEELTTLPAMTLRGCCHTVLELRSKFRFTRFQLDFDESLPEGLLQVSSDLYDELRHFLTRDRESRREPAKPALSAYGRHDSDTP